MIGLSCYILADTFFVSRGLGADGLTALNLAIPVYSFLHGSGLMIGMGGGTKYAIYRSQGDEKAANRIFTHALFLDAVFAVCFLLVGIFFSGTILQAFGAAGNVFDMSNIYLRVLLAFAPAFLLNNLLLCFVRNDGAPQLAMAAMVGGSLSNVVLDWVFIFPCGWGMFGAAFATGLSPIISMLILSPHWFRKKNQFHVVKHRIRRRLFTGILSSGVPSLVTEVSSGVVMIAFNAIIMKLEGNIGVAAYGVIANLSLVILAVYTGMAQGIQPLLSRGYGQGEWGRIRATLRYALISMFLFSAVTYAVISLGAGPIVRAFNSEHNAVLQRMAEEGMRLYFIACPFAGCNVILSTYFTSTEQPQPAHVISILRGFLLILPLAFVFARLGAIHGVWCAFPVTELLVAVIAWTAWVILDRKQKKGRAL